MIGNAVLFSLSSLSISLFLPGSSPPCPPCFCASYFSPLLIVYAFHSWIWPSEINGVSLNLPEFVAVVMLLTFVVGIGIDYWRTKQ